MRAAPVAAAFLACGLFDGVLSLLNGAPSGVGSMLSMFMITAGFWLGLAALTWAGLRLTSRMVGDEELAALLAPAFAVRGGLDLEPLREGRAQ